MMTLSGSNLSVGKAGGVRRAGSRGQDPEEMRGVGKVVEEARLRSRTSGNGRSLAIAGVSH